jgi:hypothetical protein
MQPQSTRVDGASIVMKSYVFQGHQQPDGRNLHASGLKSMGAVLKERLQNLGTRPELANDFGYPGF